MFDRSVLVSNGFLHEAILAKTEPATARLLAQGIDLSQWFVPQVGAASREAGMLASCAVGSDDRHDMDGGLRPLRAPSVEGVLCVVPSACSTRCAEVCSANCCRVSIPLQGYRVHSGAQLE